MANIVNLMQVKTWLRYPNPTTASPDDMALQWVINAADTVIEYECDDILPKLISERHSGGGLYLYTKRVPVLSVENIEEGWGYVNYELDFVPVNSPAPVTSMFAYSLDNQENGKISRRSAGNVQIPFHPGEDNIFIQYRVGEETIPGNVFLAELELIAHWWQNSQLRGVAMAGTNISYDAVQGQVYTRDTESGEQNMNIGVPYRILEMIKSHRHRPIIA